MEGFEVPRRAGGAEDDGEGAFVILVEGGAGAFVVVVGGIGPEDGGGAGAEDLEAVVEVLTRREGLGAEAGGWVVEFDER